MSQQAVSHENVLEVRDVDVTFDMDRGTSRVLDDVSLDVRRGEILGVVGESGSGKSMLASAMLDAVVNPGKVDGDITYHDGSGRSMNVLDLEGEELKRLRWGDIAMVFQGAMSFFNPTMRIRGHFLETLKAHDEDVDAGMERARELLTDLHLEPERVLDTYPHELSGGMKQRALIALSLILDPEVLVMDEPTAALDLLMQRSILTLLEDLQEKYDLTIVFITHDLPLVQDLCDRIAVMYAFDVVEVFHADDLSNSQHPYTRSLLNTVPNLTTPLDELKAIEGSSPDPVDVPPGCSYHPRCPLATEECRREEPPLEPLGPGQEVACFHHDEVDGELPLILEDDSSEYERIEGRQSDEPVVTLDDVEVHFEDDGGGFFGLFSDPNVVRAVDGVDLDIYENDVVAVVGESGCGKTTLGKTAVGLQEPTGGSVNYRGQDVWEAKKGKAGDGERSYDDIRRALQIIHQDPGSSLNPNRKVSAILQVPMKRWKPDLDKEDRWARVLAMLESAGMSPPEDYAERFPHQLSGGEQQRVALIRALLMNPDLILADEAVSALDVSMRVDMMDLMLTLQDLFDTSYLFISHNLTNARYLTGRAGGRIAVMYLGEIVEIGPAEEIVRNPKHPYTQALHWATTDITDGDETHDEAPISDIDIPDPVDPPSGCRFHPRCPKAREACTETNPELQEGHTAACFRDRDDDHPYWDSEPLDNEVVGVGGDAP
ncbi:dipeptide ABC transporter ATP-binding protein [Halorarum halophilum]|uniref:Dipeptide ABC transporter ATP-binding protein n=1 Tax=Halorarum halophilum TaxID=2743090 RepID=A0A7D5KXY9_9EURY|nr:dipeptide ABC transporter ATP-binding protein [Halobaculum halophilum]QLG29018.1 dipeptide ABC transporter ATP-binding protein [Halobaculum halophilum]